MYRCKECNATYKEKVEYCECGNNTFEYIQDKVVKNRQPLTLEQKSEIISRIFFALCLILSLVVWAIPVSNPKHKPKSEPVTTQIQQIPNINKIWDDTPLYQPKEQQTEVRTEPIPLTPTPVDYARRITLPQNTNKPEITKTVQNNTKPVVQQPVKPKVKEVTKIVEQNQYNPNSPAMLKYKSELRAALFSKFAVGSIQGAGSCSIEFSVDKSGKLINRKFMSESTNKSLNDSVYYMLMSLPYFKTPPEEYNSEPIRMIFSINNGDYEITIN